MNLKQAVNLLEKAENVHEWNEIRESIKAQVLPHVWIRDYVPTIDVSGLIVTVLKNKNQENEGQ
jgi:hypothetical protein